MGIEHYNYCTKWSPDNNEHVGLCLEFPSLSFLAQTPEDALAGIRKTVAKVVSDMRSNGEAIPKPSYS